MPVSLVLYLVCKYFFAAMESKTNPKFLLSLLFLSLCLKSHICFGADTITANQSLSGDQTIVSAGGKFELGFFKPGNTSNYYIGIWYYKKVASLQTIVWVANREQPVSDRFSSELRISDGNLVLFNESKTPIWSTDVSSNLASSIHVVLLDNGNLMLRAGSNLSLPLWQSFDYPTHTWLPEARIGFNTVTNRTQVLTSWKNFEDPAPGSYSLELDPNGTDAYFSLWNRSKQYWTSGAWDAESRIFSLVPEMRRNYIYNFSYVKNKNESYFTYSVYDAKITSRFIMHVSGQIQQLSWFQSEGWILFWSNPRKLCQVYSYCGAFGSCNEKSSPFCNCLHGFEPKLKVDWDLQVYSSGCKRRTVLNFANATTNNGKQDRFLEMPSMSLPDNEASVEAGSTTQCESICLSNRSCTAYAYDSNGCSIWIGDLLNLQQLTADDGDGSTLYLRLAASEFKDPRSKKGLIIGVAVGSAVGIAALLGLIVKVLRNRNRVIGKSVDGSLVAFEYRDLQEVTKNFWEKLGGGGFGSVFKGTMPDSSVIYSSEEARKC